MAEKQSKLLTLLLIHQKDRILLGYKKRGFGIGKYNGFGGKVEKGETILQAAIRETQEECGVTPTNARFLAWVTFEFEGQSELLEVHLYKATKFEGEIIETEEMKPEWFDINKIPFDKMWIDDKFWFPNFLTGQPFQAYFLFRGQEEILDMQLNDMSYDQLSLCHYDFIRQNFSLDLLDESYQQNLEKT